MSPHNYTRRNFLKAIGTGAASAALAGCRGACELLEGDTSGESLQTQAEGNTPRGRPNILFFFTDDQRFDTIRSLGNGHIITPNVDRLVRAGVSFTHAHIQGSFSGAVCMPSRAMLMTGRSLWRCGGSRLKKEHVTLPEVLRRAGYATFHTGKWHQDRAAFARCFSAAGKVFFGGMSDHWKVPVHDFDPGGRYPRQERYTGGKHSSELFTDAAIEFLRGHRGEGPFFMYVSYTAPHDPRIMPKQYLDLYDPGKLPIPPSFMPEHPFDNGEMRIRDEKLAPWPRTPEVIRRHLAAYYAMITHLDAEMGRLLRALEETGRAEDTIVVFSSDNGLAVGRHGLLGKQNLYDHSVRVPLVISGPGIPKGERRDSLCYLLDIYPTLCDLVAEPIPETVEGRSLVPALVPPPAGGEAGARDSLYAAYKHFQRMVRTDDGWKLILYNVGGRRRTQLFNVRDDPWETRNLAGDPAQAGRIEKLTDVLKGWMKETGDPLDLGKPNWGHVPRQRRKPKKPKKSG